VPRKKKIVTGPEGNDLKSFQANYAEAWRRIVDTPAYQAGVQFLRNRKLNSIANLSDDQIKQNSEQLLGDLKGYLQHENELGNLYEMVEFTLPFEEPDEYISPEQEAEQNKLREKFREENKRQRYG
jgi:hypothetical protein